MTVSKTIWFWRRRKFERFGWRVEGGIWPLLRIVRPMKMDDYFYGDDAEPKLRGLSAVVTPK